MPVKAHSKYEPSPAMARAALAEAVAAGRLPAQLPPEFYAMLARMIRPILQDQNRPLEAYR